MDKQQLQEYMDAVKKEGVLIEGSLLVPASVLSELREAAERADGLAKEVLDYENREASVCPEDVGCDEFIPVLQKKLEAAEAQRDRLEKALREIVKFSKAHRTILIGSLVDVQREDIIGRAAEALKEAENAPSAI